MSSSLVIDRFLAAVAGASIADCDVWSADATWRRHMPDPAAAEATLTRLLARASRRVPLENAPGKSGARLERVVIDGQDYVLKQLDLAEDWTMRAAGVLRGEPLELWERGILDRLPGCINQPIVAAAAVPAAAPAPSGAVARGGRAVSRLRPSGTPACRPRLA